MHNSRRSAIHPTVLLIALIACSSDGTEDSLQPTIDATDSMTLELEIGDGSTQEEQFGYIVGARRTADGLIYVLDAMSRQLITFDSAGNSVRALGGIGSGPGEFEGPVVLDVHDGTPRVWDQQLWRVTHFDSIGAVISTVSVPARRESGWAPSIAAAGDQWLYLDQEIETPTDSGAKVSSGIIRGVANLMRWRPGSHWSRVAQFPGMEAAFDASAGTLSNAPFPGAPLWAPASDSSFWYADNRAYRVRQITFAGDTLVRIDVPRQGPTVTDGAWDRYVGGPKDDFSSAGAKARAKLPRPERLPALQRLVVSDRGELWVQLQPETGAATLEWHVYAADGAPRFKLNAPLNLRIMAVEHDHIIAVAVDSLQVQTVRSYRFQRAP